MKGFSKFGRILRGSKRYEFDGTFLTLTDYYSGDQVVLDLGAIDKEMFEELVVDSEDGEVLE